MNSLYLSLGAILCLTQIFAATGSEHWFKIKEVSYMVDTDHEENFYGSVEFCNKHRMVVMAMETKEQTEALLLELKKILAGAHGKFWSSGSRLGNDADWTWLSTGQKITDFHWGSGEPNNEAGDQKCLSLFVNFYNNGGWWDDVECSYKRPAICQSSVY